MHYRLSLASLFAILGLAWSSPAHTQGGTSKSILVSIADSSGKPVRGLTAADFRIREDGVDRIVMDVEPATQPMFISILADTSQASSAPGLIRDIRVSLTAFARHIGAASPDTQLALMEFGQASILMVDYTTKVANIERGIMRLFPKPSAASVLLEAILATAKDIGEKKSPRRAIVILNIEPGNEQSRQRPEIINDVLRKSGASVWAVSLQQGPLRNASQNVVLEAVTQFSGGAREFILGQSAMTSILKRFGDLLTSQYEVTFARPSGSTAQGIQLGVVGQGMTMYVPRYAPQ